LSVFLFVLFSKRSFIRISGATPQHNKNIFYISPNLLF